MVDDFKKAMEGKSWLSEYFIHNGTFEDFNTAEQHLSNILYFLMYRATTKEIQEWRSMQRVRLAEGRWSFLASDITPSKGPSGR